MFPKISRDFSKGKNADFFENFAICSWYFKESSMIIYVNPLNDTFRRVPWEFTSALTLLVGSLTFRLYMILTKPKRLIFFFFPYVYQSNGVCHSNWSEICAINAPLGTVLICNMNDLDQGWQGSHVGHRSHHM